MGCSTCTYLELALENWSSAYTNALSASYRQVSSRFMAYDLVELERARSELEMHRSVCVYTAAQAVRRPIPPVEDPILSKIALAAAA